jgi:hypothetical protein
LLLVAIKVFYDQNIISVDIELFKLANIISPLGSDLSLAKRLLITFNSSRDEQERNCPDFNSVNFKNLFARIEATLPVLQSIVVHTVGCTLPSTSLFNIGQHCITSPAYFTNVEFRDIGCLVAIPRSRCATMTVEYKSLTNMWEELAGTAFQTTVLITNHFRAIYDSTEGRIREAFISRILFNAGVTPIEDDAGNAVRVLKENCPAFGTPGVHGLVFWTHIACPYIPY